ncbi:MAG TPA: C-terminal binding protein [Solirubrobacter sp.]|nr:C-terminal binding protein [Solirubrobacter sp.]
MTPVVVVTDTPIGDDSLERALASELRAEYRRGDALDGADVVFTNFAELGADELARLADGAVVIRYGVGVDNVDLAAAAAQRVRVCNVPDYGANVVADHAVTLALMLVRRMREFDTALHRGEDPDPDAFGPIASLEGLTVGLVGAGRIARMAAARFRAFGCATIAYDPLAEPVEGLPLVPWAELLARSDVLSLHAPLTDETRHLLDDDAFAAMRRGVYVVNTARGGLVDPDALLRALDAGIVAGAGLDVTEPEPLPRDAALRARPEVILTPHVAFYSIESMQRLQRLAVEEARRALAGEPLRSPVPLSVGDV